MIFKFKYFFLYVLINFIDLFSIFRKKDFNCILLYHSISPKNLNNSIDFISKSNFEDQCKLLSSKYRKRIQKFSLNFKFKGSISISFDDGHESLITIVLPIIKKYKIPIIIFICPELIGKPNYLNVNDIKKLLNSKLVEIGIHGYNHYYYGIRDLTTFKEDLKKSLSWFKTFLGLKDPKFFSFPHGSFNSKMINYIKKNTNIDFCCNSEFSTFDNHNVDLNYIPRIAIWHTDSLRSFDQKLNSKWNLSNFFIKNNEIKS